MLATGAAAVLATGLAVPGSRRLRAQSAPSPAAARRKIGTFEVTVLSDGHLTMPISLLDRSRPDAEIAGHVSAGLTAPGQLAFAINIALVRTPTDLVLIDAGAGGAWQASAGKLADALASAGIALDQISKVIITHTHPDHIWGVVDDLDDSLRFPKAEYFVPAPEWDYWMQADPQALPEAIQSVGAGAKRTLKAIEGKTRRVAPGASALSGFTYVDTAGHTPGHCSVLVGDGSDRLLVTADAVHHATTSFQFPDWQPRADMDGARAIASRRKLLDMAAADKLAVLAYHLPYPGLGRVERTDTAYRWVAG